MLCVTFYPSFQPLPFVLLSHLSQLSFLLSYSSASVRVGDVCFLTPLSLPIY